jgi:hypothetical protein
MQYYDIPCAERVSCIRYSSGGFFSALSSRLPYTLLDWTRLALGAMVMPMLMSDF